MPTNDDKRISLGAAGLILGVCVGVGCFFYLKSRQTKGLKKCEVASEEIAIRDSPPLNRGDILLFHNAKGINKFITMLTSSPFYHVALYSGDGNVIEAITSGVVNGDLSGRDKDYIVVPSPHGRGEEAILWAETQIGDGYDFMDLAFIFLERICKVIHFNYTSASKYSCGEFVATAYDNAGVHNYPKKELSEVIPGDFAQFAPSLDLKKVE